MIKKYFIALVLILTVLSTHASDWPQYKRDSARTGDAAEEVLKFPMQRVVAVRFPAPIYASPAVVGGKVYIQDARGNAACVDADTNKVLWHAKLDGVTNYSSPAMTGGKVYIGSSGGYLAILDAASGRLIKKVSVGGQVFASPAVTSEAVYFSTTTAKLVKIDVDGKIIWTFAGNKESYTEFAVRGREILFVEAGSRYGGHARVSVIMDGGKDVKRGKRYRATYGAGPLCPTGGPVFGKGGQFAIQGFDSESGGLCIFERDPEARKGRAPVKGKSGPSLIWRDAGPLIRWNDSRVTPSYRSGRYFRGDICCSPDGYIWQADPETLVSGGSQSSPALAKGHLAVGNDNGKVLFFPVKPEIHTPAKTVKGATVMKPVWSFKTSGAGKPNGGISSSPAVSGGRVFFGGEDGILYGLGKGKETTIVDALSKGQMAARTFPGAELKGPEWHSAGGDMGYSAVSADTTLKPPFRIKWRTRVWNSAKGPVIVAAGMVFQTGRTGQLTALDAETGEIIWRLRHTNKVVESRPSAVYADGKLLVMRGSFNMFPNSPSGGGGVWCHDAATGKLLWHRPAQIAYHYNPDGLAVLKGHVLVCWPDENRKIQAAALSIKDGKEAWRQSLGVRAGRKGRRFSVVAGDGRWYLSLSSAGTFCMEAADGRILWKTGREYAITGRSRLAFRKGVLIAFNLKGAHALEPGSGKVLWTGRGVRSKGYARTYSAQALTDGYLDSKGQKDIFMSNICSYPVFVNGTWFVHLAHSNLLLAFDKEVPLGTSKRDFPTLWKRSFMSNSCPPVSPAYGRLYYTPCGEGVVYCFENAAGVQQAAPSG